MAALHNQLEILLQIQDLKAQRDELAGSTGERKVQEEEFHLNADEAVELLDAKITELEEQLQPAVRSRYRRISSGLQRVVVPAISGICYGCFVSIPTSVASDAAGPGQEQLLHCENCGRFIYVVD
jgi:predicted  nucleic acid-binding Zn-ribbon protein